MNTNPLKNNFDDAWLGLGDLSQLSLLDNPMIHRSESNIENPDLHLARLLRDPKYLGTTCKLLLNIELHPLQIVTLQEMWIRAFPMLIASRGFSKSFTLALYSILKCSFVPGTKAFVKAN